MADEKINNDNAEYLGRKITAKGTTNNKDWAVYKLTFNIGQNERYFSCFSSTKGFDTLKEGETYGIGWVLDPYTNKEGKEVQGRKIINIGETRESNNKVAEEVDDKMNKEDYWASKEEDILIGQSINLAVQHLGFTKQDLSTSNIEKTAENYKNIILAVKDKLKGSVAGRKEAIPTHPKDETEIKEVKDLIESMGGTATIDQLTHKFGEGTVAMLMDLGDDFIVTGNTVEVKK